MIIYVTLLKKVLLEIYYYAQKQILKLRRNITISHHCILNAEKKNEIFLYITHNIYTLHAHVNINVK